MIKKRIYDVAKEHKISSKAMVDVIRKLGFEVKSHSSTVGSEVLQAVNKKLTAEKEEVKKGLEKKKEKAKKRKKEEEELKKAKKEAEKRILAELAKTEKKTVKKTE